MTRKFLFLTLLLAFLAALAWSLPAAADSVTVSGTLTADNGFALYYGAADGTDLYLITYGSNWQSPVKFTENNVPVGDYLYVVAWNLPDGADGGNSGSADPQAWLGQFSIGNSPQFIPIYRIGNISIPKAAIPPMGVIRTLRA